MLKADLHIHTNYSDGRDNVRKILAAAITKNLDVIAITDHNTMQGSLEAINIVEEEHLPIIRKMVFGYFFRILGPMYCIITLAAS